MTSRTGATRPRRGRAAPPPAFPPLATKPLRPRGGFTLIEVLLALVLLCLLAGVGIVALEGRADVEALQAGAFRLETAMRMARAEAANQGRRLRLVFDSAGGPPAVLWEPEPLTEPGRFSALAGCTWQDSIELDGVIIEKCEFIGPSAYRAVDTGTAGGGADQSAFAPITFEPDGSSDSVVIELAPAGDPESRRAVIELDGLTGTVVSRVLTASEMAQP